MKKIYSKTLNKITKSNVLKDIFPKYKLKKVKKLNEGVTNSSKIKK
jgi:hypothetical protein